MHVQHSFGGSALDRHVFDFEALGDGMPGAGLGDPAGGDPAGGEPAGWSLSQDDWTSFQEQQQQLASTVEMLAGLEQQRAAPYLQPREDQGPPQLDPFSETFGEQLVGLIRNELAPFSQRFESMDQQDGQARIADVLTDLEASKGEFLEPTREAMHELAKAHARELYPQFAAKMGNGDQAAEAALEAAFEYARGVESKLVEAAIARHTNEIATLAGAPRPAGASYSEGTRVRAVPDWRSDNRTIAQKLLEEQAS